MKHRLSLLRRLVIDRAPELMASLERLEVGGLAEAERDRLREVVAAELVERGLMDNEEPTAYGCELEALIDFIGPSGG